MPLDAQLAINLLAILAAMCLLWLPATLRGDVSIVDIFWGVGFALIVWCLGPPLDERGERAWLLTVLVTLWGLRLAGYLLWRKWGEAEDRRYTAMRANHRERFWWVSLFTVFLLQGGLMWLIALPVQVGLHGTQPLNALDAAGIVLWLIGFLFESIGDFQMARFQSDPANRQRVMQSGLWHYTRHPNYFGDFCVWWGLYLIAVAGGGWWTVVGPIAMSVLLLRISGVTLLESTIGDRRPDYADYRRRTNAFFPGPPRSA